MNQLDFYILNTFHYPYIPAEEIGDSTWINFSNKYFDPIVGHQVYKEQLEISVAAEKFGFDGTLVNEHHSTAYGIQPAPNLTAMNIIARTSQIPVGVIGNAIPHHSNPIRVAEEVAMLDVISGGRVICGLVVGNGMEYYNQPINPVFARDRFWEAHDLIIKSWTQPGPFVWEGENYHIPNVNPWPTPLQRPHPPIWIPGAGSPETIRRSAELRYTYMTVYLAQETSAAIFRQYREEALRCGYEPDRRQMLAGLPIYVAETDAQAHREAKAHLSWLYNTGLRHPLHFFMPPGYTSPTGFSMMTRSTENPDARDLHSLSYEDLVRDRRILVGSPQTVASVLQEHYVEKMGVGGIIGAGGVFGPMPQWMVMKTMQMMSEEVFPLFRAPGAKPSYMLQERPCGQTNAERAFAFARVGRAKSEQADGDVVDLMAAHVPDYGVASSAG